MSDFDNTPCGYPTRVVELESNFNFLIRIVGGGVHTGSTRHVGHIWPILPALGDFEDGGEFGGMKIGRGTKVLGENLPQRHFVYHKSHLTSD
jgi:hypothetical protein